MKKYLAEINGAMEVVTKTGRVARKSLPSEMISPRVCSMVLKEGEITHLEVEEVARIGRGKRRHWVSVSNLYEVSGENPHQ